jgi:hypothetical protein
MVVMGCHNFKDEALIKDDRRSKNECYEWEAQGQKK